MILAFVLIMIGVIGLIVGLKNNNKAIAFSAIALLIFVAVVYALYMYLYTQTPY